MVQLLVKRTCDPTIVQQFIEAIESIRKSKQIANLNRIIKYMEREHNHEPKEVLQYLHKAVTDGLIIETITVGCKGSKAGVEQEGYWIPDKKQVLHERENEDHDWYCFICHNPGDVVECSSCTYVYHMKCVDIKNRKQHIKEKWTCPMCSNLKRQEKKQDKDELTKCLNFIINQQKDYTSELKRRLSDQTSYHDFFIFNYYDYKTLQRDCYKFSFSGLEEFRQKVLLIEHNYNVMFGKDHHLTKVVQEFVKDSMHDLRELQLCKNCFLLSNAKPSKDWFCQPCEPPHQVVWAKQKGFDFWPAKVMRVEDHRLDVRFFGKHHPRAWVPIDAIRSICFNPSELRVKRKQQWKQSSNEMLEYIRQCEFALGEEVASKIILYDSPYGIGRNKTLLAAMKSLRKHQNGSISSLHSALNPNKSNNKEILEDSSLLNGESMDHSRKNAALPKLYDVKVVIDEKLPETEIRRAPKRSLESDSEEETFKGDKKQKQTEELTLNSSTQTGEMLQTDQQIQVSPSDFDGNSCSCRLRYGVILQKFKNYVKESSRLENSKLIRAAVVKAAYDQRQAEDRMRKDVTAEFEEVIAEMKENHEKQLREIKLKQWCCVCLKEATIHCCKNISYCSNVCMKSNYAFHKADCSASNSCNRPRRIIKPKIMDL